MRKASIHDLRIRTSELVREAAEGAVILIERRGEPVAELRRFSKKNASDIWSRFPAVRGDSGRFSQQEDGE